MNQLNTIRMAFLWWADRGPILFVGVSVMVKHLFHEKFTRRKRSCFNFRQVACSVLIFLIKNIFFFTTRTDSRSSKLDVIQRFFSIDEKMTF